VFIQMNPTLKDWLQAGAWVATAVGLIFTALKFRSEVKERETQRVKEQEARKRQRQKEIEQRDNELKQRANEQKQRKDDLRWRQAQAGKSLNDEMQTDPKAWPAMQMLDSSERRYILPSVERVSISKQDVRAALDVNTTAGDEKSVYIRDCFDSLFYFMAMMEHYISSTLILYEDVAFPMEYYVPLLANFRREVAAYLDKYKLTRTVEFLKRFPAWTGATDVARREIA
jgi:hypothetical protein